MKNNVGILLPISALPGNHGIGDFGNNTYKFIDWLNENGYHYWQILPLNPIGPANSPYMSICSSAIDFRYISLDLLVKDKLISDAPKFNEKAKKVNYEKVASYKKKYLSLAYASFIKDKQNKLKAFILKNPWVKEYATFKVFSRINKNKYWNLWDKKYIEYFKYNKDVPNKYLDEINYYCFEQYISYKQWKNVLSYARKKNVSIIADMPFYVGVNSSDTWIHNDLFKFDENYQQTEVGGVPPDYFSEDGQLWGSPIYDFDKMKADNYSWWISRIKAQLELCDYLRIDHFRAFDTYYVIPSSSNTAKNGKWEIGPRNDFFDELYKQIPSAKLIAEDLGEMFPSVYELRDHYHLPGMYVAQFCLLDYSKWGNENLIVYTGTHDNQTFLSWFNSLDETAINILKDRTQSKGNLYIDLLNTIYNMPSRITIFPIQDVLMLDDKARFNVPGTEKDNWTWRITDFALLNKQKIIFKDKLD